jgi:hypothetical protein
MMNYRNWCKYTAWWFLISVVLLALPVASQAQLHKEQVMTALIYNFARFVTWPEGSFPAQDAPLVIAVMGDGSMQRELSSLLGKQVEERRIVVRQISFKEALGQNSPWHILYIPQSSPRRLASLMDAVAKQPVLTISTMQDFVRKGGVLHLQDTLPTVAFSINLDSAEEAGLTISSKLFRLADTVIKNGQVREGP